MHTYQECQDMTDKDFDNNNINSVRVMVSRESVKREKPHVNVHQLELGCEPIITSPPVLHVSRQQCVPQRDTCRPPICMYRGSGLLSSM